MSNFMGVGIFWIGLNRADLGCWRLTLRENLTYICEQTLEKTDMFHYMQKAWN